MRARWEGREVRGVDDGEGGLFKLNFGTLYVM